MALTLAVKQRTRQYTRQRVTKLCTKISLEFETLNTFQRNAYVDRLYVLRSTLSALDQAILDICLEEEKTEEQLDILAKDEDHYEELFADTLSRLKTDHAENNAESNVVQNVRSQGTHKLKLPQVSFPKFSNAKGENLQKFLKEFESTISTHNLTSYVKFTYLKDQLGGAPRMMINSLSVTEQLYETAKDLLIQSFDSASTSKYNIIQKLAELKLPIGSEPYGFIAEMRTVISDFASLDITVDDMLQYFIWEGLNIDFQSHLVGITNKSKPNLTEISSNIFEAKDRYIKQNERKVKQKPFGMHASTIPGSATALAVNVEPRKPSYLCFLCSSDKQISDHAMTHCPIYDNPQKKIDKLKNLKACTKCSFRSHTTADCSFKFKSDCRHCKGKHMSYLCVKAPNSSKAVSANTVTEDHSDLDDSVSPSDSVDEIIEI